MLPSSLTGFSLLPTLAVNYPIQLGLLIPRKPVHELPTSGPPVPLVPGLKLMHSEWGKIGAKYVEIKAEAKQARIRILSAADTVRLSCLL